MCVELKQSKMKMNCFLSSSVLLQTMAQALAPAYLRVSGTDADRMTFKKTKENGIDHNIFFPPSSFFMTGNALKCQVNQEGIN